MSLKKFLRRLETIKGESFGQRCALCLITGACKAAGFLLKASEKVGGETRAQVFIEYLMLMVALALFTIVLTTGSFFTNFRSNMDRTTDFAMNKMDQPGFSPSPSTGSGVTIPWWNEEIEAGSVPGGGVAW